jgi:transposase
MAQARQLILTDEQYRDLLDCREHHPKAYMREKAAAILKVAQGQALRQVAAHGLLRPRQPKPVGRWIDRYLAQGRAGLLVRTGRGRKPAFSPSQPRRGQKRLARATLS